MLLDLVSGFGVAPQSGATATSCCSSSSVMASLIPRVVVLLLLLLAGAVVVFYGKSLCASSSNWKVALSSTPAGAWILSQFENDPVKTLNKGAVEDLAKDHRLNMDSVAARRLSRAKFLELHSEFDFNVPPVINPMHVEFVAFVSVLILERFLRDFVFALLARVQACKKIHACDFKLQMPRNTTRSSVSTREYIRNCTPKDY